MMAHVENQQTPQRRFISIKAKWAVGTGLGVLVIFAVFALLLFQSFSSLLLREQRQETQAVMQTVTSRLDTTTEMTPAAVRTALGRQHQTGNYRHDVYSTLAQRNLCATVYAPTGRRLFTTHKPAVSFYKQAPEERVNMIRHHTVLTLKRSIRGKDGRLRGYVQVERQLQAYDQTRIRLAITFLILGVTAAFASALLAYGLAAWFIRPIDAINTTIGKINADDEGQALANVRVSVMPANDELTELAVLFNDMLNRMNRYVEQQQQFVEDVSHELRTPVAIIQGHLDMLNRWGKDDPEILTESISASLQEINRMKSLVQEMLDLTRAEQIEVHFVDELTDVREVGIQTFNNIQMIHPDFDFVLDNELTGPTMVNIYRNHFEQILIILLDNAVKYSQKRKEVHVSMDRDERSVQVVVQDFGEGIAPENIKKIFNRFYRVDKARSRDKGGNGLGLAIAQRLVEGYHGEITVESAPGHGSLFRITLPLAKPNNG